jgi:hypothetical protein
MTFNRNLAYVDHMCGAAVFSAGPDCLHDQPNNRSPKEWGTRNDSTSASLGD